MRASVFLQDRRVAGRYPRSLALARSTILDVTDAFHRTMSNDELPDVHRLLWQQINEHLVSFLSHQLPFLLPHEAESDVEMTADRKRLTRADKSLRIYTGSYQRHIH